MKAMHPRVYGLHKLFLIGLKKEKKTKYWVGRKEWIDLGEVGEGRI